MKQKANSNVGVGIGMIFFGTLFLVNQVVEINWEGMWVLPLIALGFIIAGIVQAKSGFFIPAGILSGVSLGATLSELPMANGDIEGGIFLLGFAAGWALIPLLSILFTADRNLWALIPGGILAVIGLGVIQDGWILDALALVGNFWPLILVAVGVSIILKSDRFKIA